MAVGIPFLCMPVLMYTSLVLEKFHGFYSYLVSKSSSVFGQYQVTMNIPDSNIQAL
jgi:hypothetical protein